MRIILGFAGIIITLMGVFLPPIQALLPKISLYFYYKQLAVRRLFYAVGLLLACGSVLSEPDTFTWVALIVVAVFILWGEFLLVPAKVIPPLDHAVSAAIKPVDFSDKALVIGIEIEGQARAYPLSLLIPHHIVNDNLGAVPVAATYCPACRSGYIYDPVVKGKRLTFEPVSVRRRNMVMKDRETGSVWQHETGICLMGEFKGQQLGILPSEMCNWGAWVSEHPDTTLCLRPDGYRHSSPLGHVFEKLLEHGPERLVGPGFNKRDNRLGQHDLVAGILVGGIPKAYPLQKLIEQGMIRDNIGGISVKLLYEEKANRVKAFKQTSTATATDLESIPVARQWWLAWSEYHPHSELFE